MAATGVKLELNLGKHSHLVHALIITYLLMVYRCFRIKIGQGWGQCVRRTQLPNYRLHRLSVGGQQ